MEGKCKLQTYVLDHPGTNYYGGESLGGRRYFTAVYAEAAIVNACADRHIRNPDTLEMDQQSEPGRTR